VEISRNRKPENVNFMVIQRKMNCCDNSNIHVIHILANLRPNGCWYHWETMTQIKLTQIRLIRKVCLGTEQLAPLFASRNQSAVLLYPGVGQMEESVQYFASYFETI
jgi:hypothetical protein